MIAPPTTSVRKLPDTLWQEPSRWGGMASAVAILLAVVEHSRYSDGDRKQAPN